MIGGAGAYKVLCCWIQFDYIDESSFQKKQHRCNCRVSIDLRMQYCDATIRCKRSRGITSRKSQS